MNEFLKLFLKDWISIQIMDMFASLISLCFHVRVHDAVGSRDNSLAGGPKIK